MMDELRKFFATPFLVFGMLCGWIGSKILGCEFEVNFTDVHPDTGDDDDDLFV
jgi:hypothetical protein